MAASGKKNMFNEATRVQMPAMVHLTRLGYTYFGKITEDMAGTVYDLSFLNTCGCRQKRGGGFCGGGVDLKKKRKNYTGRGVPDGRQSVQVRD